VAIAEALERYSSCVLPTDLIWATPRELGDRAIDLDTLPQCSDAELAHPKCPASRVDPDETMRWTTAWSLTGGRPVMVPAVNVWMHIPPLTASERYTMPISTGCATHTDIHRALASAICEVIERDAISLTWLQRLPLKRVVFDDVPEALARSLEATAAKGIVTTFFDATSELGVPTLYSVDESRADTKVRHVVMCATDLDPAAAATKMLREVASSRIALSRHEPPPASWDDFTSVFHGAMFMGAPEQSSAYDFLLRQDNGARTFSTMPTLSTGSAEDDLQLLLRTLDAHGMEALAVEMTTREARLVGFRVVRVIIPQLMPLAFTHRARFLGHRRLYDGPVAMGFPAHPEDDINPFPQPFA
jgi:ribosomal protein S12 methylthiotransferase accessory factor